MKKLLSVLSGVRAELKSAVKKAFLRPNMKLDYLVSVRLYNILRRNGVITVSDVLKTSVADVKEFKYVGRKSSKQYMEFKMWAQKKLGA